MDGISCMSPFKSPIFQIRVGDPASAEIFYAHASVLSQSPVLKRQIEGPWKETAEKKIIWPHWSPGAAAKFLEWLYTEDYSCPHPTPAPGITTPSELSDDEGLTQRDVDEPSLSDTALSAAAESMSNGETVSYKQRSQNGEVNTRWPPSTSPLQSILDLDWTGLCPLEDTILSQAATDDMWLGYHLWTPSELDYSGPLMLHAQLYVMACHYLLPSLKSTAWQRLRAVLVRIGKPSLCSPLMRHLADLISYTYRETGPTDDYGEEEPLRALLSGYAGLHFTSLRGAGVDELLLSKEEGDREFVVDLVERTRQQMAYFETTVRVGVITMTTTTPGKKKKWVKAKGKGEKEEDGDRD
ncbi:MAG: hypothetical protein L6R39_002468, partial [Caloplaca ligustica]